MNFPPDIEDRNVEGPTLRDLLEEGLVPIGLALEIARQILRMLDEPEGQGSPHRDISPESLRLTRDSTGAPRVKWIDPGAARGAAEQSAASDIHSFGVLLYELLTGVHPFQGRSVALRPGEPPPSPLDFEVSDRAGRIPPDLRALVLAAIAEDPEGRFGSAEEMDAELARIQSRFPLDASPTIALGSLPPRASWIGAPAASRLSARRPPGPPAQAGLGTSRRPSRLRLSTRLGASIVLALLLLVLLTGLRFLSERQAEPDTAVISEPADVAETLPDAPQLRREPLAGPGDLPRAAPEPAPREQTRRKPAPRKVRSERPAPSRERRQAPGTPGIRVAGGPDFFESEPAVLRSLPAASYPEAARGTGTRAEVVVGVTIDETGAVRDPTIESARVQGNAPESAFREAALAAARRARFEPAREGGRPVRSTSTLTFTFGTSQ